MKTPITKLNITIIPIVVALVSFVIGVSSVKAVDVFDEEIYGNESSGSYYDEQLGYNRNRVGFLLVPPSPITGVCSISFYIKKYGSPTQPVKLKILKSKASAYELLNTANDYLDGNIDFDDSNFANSFYYIAGENTDTLLPGVDTKSGVFSAEYPITTISSASPTTSFAPVTFYLDTCIPFSKNYAYAFILNTEYVGNGSNYYAVKFTSGWDKSKSVTGIYQSGTWVHTTTKEPVVQMGALWGSIYPVGSWGWENEHNYQVDNSGKVFNPSNAYNTCDTYDTLWKPFCYISTFLFVPNETIEQDFDASKNALYGKFPFSIVVDVYDAWDSIYDTKYSTSSWTETMTLNLDNASNSHSFNLGTKSLQFIDTGILPSIFNDGIIIVRGVFVMILYAMALLTAYYVVIRAL